MTITAERLAKAVDELDLAGRPVMVHASLRSFGEPVEGGPDAVLDALLSRGCTVLVPAFTETHFGAFPPTTMRPARNGIDYAALPDEGPWAPVYSPDCGLINPHLGAVPAALIARDGARRGDHPLNSFAALGPLAAELTAAQRPDDVYGPIREAVRRDGEVLLIGVGLNRMTAIHLAEHQAGRRLLVRWAYRPDGRVFMVETGSCSEGFPRLEPWLRPHERTAAVGASRWHAYPAREAVAAATDAIAADWSATRCPDPGCVQCPDVTAGGPLGTAPLG
ncbi:aminoglycoside N(3)-acetyltransferase [Actinomadura craniellae]|uniref:Aminoglycoside N(3)-acetyltransferase n=1 Tax=Actinomadura craniellae TaxID=2231787 RepID=A0A365H571_9ACTN|nr:AAC(3) family N-acetyltransferase [Actinomadura craniellae]RAY14254.1 aminoglycoside N(3)-acetyltransferase [Actinomadura craniellae]